MLPKPKTAIVGRTVLKKSIFVYFQSLFAILYFLYFEFIQFYPWVFFFSSDMFDLLRFSGNLSVLSFHSYLTDVLMLFNLFKLGFGIVCR